jgi:hypothetical protein
VSGPASELWCDLTADGCQPTVITIGVDSDVVDRGRELEEFVDLDC